MSVFANLKIDFDINWTTMLVGWNGLGTFSPWPDRRDEFPPLFSAGELAAFAYERLASSSDVAEQDLIVKLVSLDLHNETRQEIRGLLIHLAEFDGSDPTFEFRKWRLVLLEDLLENIPKDAVYGLMALTEFWQSVGFPPESPHEVQGRGNEITPSEYYHDEKLQQMLDMHRAWVRVEKAAIMKRDHEVKNKGVSEGRNFDNA